MLLFDFFMELLLPLSVIGLLLSLYSVYVEQHMKKQKRYHPFCDIAKHVSCRKSFTGPYGHLFGVSNSILGVLFYPVLGIFVYFSYWNIVFLLSLLALCLSFYLAYISYVRMKNFCIVCSSLYVVNGIVFGLSIR